MAPHRLKQTQRAINTRRENSRSSKNKFVAPRTLEEFLAMSERHQDLWNAVGQVVTEVRTGSSLSQASRKFGVDLRMVRRLAQSAFRKLKNGRYGVKAFDRLLRVLQILSVSGPQEIAVNDSRQASQIGKHWNAVELYAQTGDASALRDFRGKYVIDANGKRVYFMTDLSELDRRASAGDLSFESLYARTAR
jgi:hypothetical protein